MVVKVLADVVLERLFHGPVAHTFLVVVVVGHVNEPQLWQFISRRCFAVYPTLHSLLHVPLHVLPESVVDVRSFVLRSGVHAFV